MSTGEVVKIGDKEYHVVEFKWAKSRVAVEMLIELWEQAGVNELISGVGEAQDNVILGKSTSAIGELFLKAPAILKKSLPLVGKLAALVLTTNEEFKEWRIQGKVIDHMLERKYLEEIESEVTMTQLVSIVSMATRYLADEPIIKQIISNVPKAVIALGKAYLGAMTQNESTSTSPASSESSTDTPTTTASTS